MCENLQQVQFLKYSPFFNHLGSIDAVLNLGVWLRTFCYCKYDLPGRGDIERRARLFNSEIVRSRVHTGNHLVHDAFKTHICWERMKLRPMDYEWRDEVTTGEQLGTVSLEELSKRYGMPVSELSHMCHEIRELKFGEVVNLPAVHKIMAIDYGY